MNYSINDILQFVAENDVKFVQLTFCDIFGKQKNLCITAEELPKAFERGISFDASAIKGFMNVTESDLFLFPLADTMVLLPFRPTGGRVISFFCTIKHPDGRFFSGDGRNILKQATEKALSMGYVVKIGAESEFYLFKLDNDGEPTKTPLDRGGYLDVSPLDRGENIRREICLAIEEMDIIPISAHHEQGPGQNEIDFKYSDALKAADNFLLFKTIVKRIAAQNGLYASFMPKPLQYEPGSGFHINMSLFHNNQNIFRSDGTHSQVAESFIAGIMEHIIEITAFLNTTTNSYLRLGKFEAPKYISWSHQNRSQLIRIPAAKDEFSRMELRSPDSTCNPYIAFALLIFAGLSGIERNLSLPKPVDKDLYTDTEDLSLEKLPDSLEQALIMMNSSKFVRSILPGTTIEKFLTGKVEELKLSPEILEHIYFSNY